MIFKYLYLSFSFSRRYYCQTVHSRFLARITSALTNDETQRGIKKLPLLGGIIITIAKLAGAIEESRFRIRISQGGNYITAIHDGGAMILTISRRGVATAGDTY